MARSRAKTKTAAQLVPGYEGAVEIITPDGPREWRVVTDEKSGETTSVTLLQGCKVNHSGSMAALYRWDETEQRPKRIDGLKKMTTEVGPEFIEYVGVSDKAGVTNTWRFYPQGCADCG